MAHRSRIFVPNGHLQRDVAAVARPVTRVKVPVTAPADARRHRAANQTGNVQTHIMTRLVVRSVQRPRSAATGVMGRVMGCVMARVMVRGTRRAMIARSGAPVRRQSRQNPASLQNSATALNLEILASRANSANRRSLAKQRISTMGRSLQTGSHATVEPVRTRGATQPGGSSV